ncbi:MAG: electron transfer flavoprotein subunit alpha/FixB family protein [bacterium]|nr:electron transfer flavoprotein subunit alpha/FixB family protein [bacterium]MDE0499796.1 electron transfer flavoprotein subunit alpha/FixB family protein [bacterium]MDE0501726.1 electron transfer flavoprotein subunit alpha/FixB family protein [bacterium]
MTRILVFVDNDRGTLSPSALEALTPAYSLADSLDASLELATVGEGGRAALEPVGLGGYVISHPVLSDYAPEAYGDALAQLVSEEQFSVVISLGDDRGAEVMAHMAAVLDQPLVANVTEIADTEGPDGSWEVIRVRWGGSLLERARLRSDLKFLTIAPHTFPAPEPNGGAGPLTTFVPEIPDSLARTRVVERVKLAEGLTLATAPVVVSGGRGVGSAENFAILEELADLLGGVVGCSRVATNNGWRPHSDQVGQTGTRIAPDLYIACGISGAVQHWVGCMASKQILAINTDPEAPLVTKADYAVIGDLHEILAAVIAEIKARP